MCRATDADPRTNRDRTPTRSPPHAAEPENRRTATADMRGTNRVHAQPRPTPTPALTANGRRPAPPYAAEPENRKTATAHARHQQRAPETDADRQPRTNRDRTPTRFPPPRRDHSADPCAPRTTHAGRHRPATALRGRPHADRHPEPRPAAKHCAPRTPARRTGRHAQLTTPTTADPEGNRRRQRPTTELGRHSAVRQRQQRHLSDLEHPRGTVPEVKGKPPF